MFELDAHGKVTQVLIRAIAENYRYIAGGEYELIRGSISFGVEILTRMPDLLADLLVESGAYAWQTVHDLATCPAPGGCGGFCTRILVPVVDDAAAVPTRDSDV